MKGTALLLLCAVTLAQASQPQLTLSGKICNCNPGEAANVCSKFGSNDELIAHENCNQFYKCFDGSAIAYDCPANLLYNPLAEICDWPENVECGNRPIIEIGDGNNGGNEDCNLNGNENDESGGGGGNGDNGNDGVTCNCNPEEAPAICAADGSDGVLVANQNCNQFYKCDHGIPVVLNCPAGLLYNPLNEQCDWARNVDCGDKPIVEIEVDGNNGGDEDCNLNGNETSESGGGNGDTETCNCNPDEAPGICSADGSDGTLVAHENCNQFYKCAHGSPVTITCPAGLVYNPYIECCDWPANVECGDKTVIEVEGGGNGEGDSGSGGSNGDTGTGGGVGDNGGGNSSEDNGGTCNCNPGDAPGICSADGSDGILVAHENCNQFYKCTHGSPVTITCPAGLVYNPYIECCDWPANVECGDKPIVEVEGGGNGVGDGGSGGGNGDNGTGGGGGNSSEDNGGTCNCNPGDAPGICSADGSDGTLIAHENCNQFYKCAHGSPVTITCPAGLVYNPYIECCDWPANVECGDKPIVEVEGGGNGVGDGGSGGGNGDNGTGGGGGNSSEDNGGTCNCNPGDAPGICSADGSDGTLIAHENCNQFYKCAHGSPVTITCPAGLVYNPYIECCDWPANVECGDKPIVEVEGGGNGVGDGGSGGGNGDNGTGGGGGNSSEDNGGTCNCNPGDAPGICSADGSDGTLVAHENCNQFYKCAHGSPVTITCPAGLVYNPYIECCDWPANVECGDKPIVEVEGGGNGVGDGGSGGGNGDNGTGGGGGNSSEDNGGTCNCNPDEAPGICSSVGSEGVLVAHENCNQFYKCANGLPVALFCPDGLLYNPYTERCDWPALVECGDRPIVEGGGGDSGSGDNGGGDSGSGDNGGGDNGGTCNCNPGEAPGICGAAGSEGTLVAHENCNQFYKCANGLPVALFCPEGLLYNPYIERCDWPALVECGDRPIVEGGSGDSGSGDNGGGDSGSGDNGGGDNGGGDNGGTCNCNPGEAPSICGAAGSEGVLVAHENCNQFYKCANGLPVALFCPDGLLYNPYTERCDWPALVECGDRPIVEGGGGDSGSGDNGGGDSGSGDNGGGDNGGGDNGGTCNCNPGEAPGICGAAGSEGVLVAHENCNQFYKCANGLPVALLCPEGLLYNPYIERCDWPALVECGDRPIVEGGGGDSSSGDNDGGDSSSGDNGSGDNGDGGNGGGDNGGTCNCNPGEAPGICGAAGSEGVLVAHENCNLFYKCANGLPVALFCPGGLLYNPYTERCDWPALVECGDRPIVEGGGGDSGSGDNGGGDSGSGDNGGGDNGGGDNGGTCNCNPGEAPGICGAAGSEGTLVAHENCNQFYKCANGLPVALFCPDGLLYNPYIERCDWPALVECGDRPIVEGGSGDSGSGDNGGGDSGSGDNGGGDNGGGDNGGTCNCNPGEAPGICGAAGSEGVLVAHENCNQFYKCANGLPVALLCPEGLLYNPYIERCDWPALVECGDRPIVEGGGGDSSSGDNDGGDSSSGDNGSGENGDGGNGGGDNGSTCNCNPGEAPGICGAAGSEGVLVAHENCNLFYKCANGLPVALSCPDGLLYNPYTERCDWPALVECGDRPIVEGGGGDSGSGDNGGGDSGSGDNGGGDNGGGDNGGTCNCNPGEAPGICGAAGSEGTLVAHENCNQFYKCANGLPVALFCPEGLLYNPYIERCDWPALVECGDRPIVEGGGGDSGSGDNGGGDSGSGDNGGGDNGGGDNGGGDNGGTCNCNPGEAPGICGAAGSEGVLVAHENCNLFYKCANGLPVALFCPEGLLYNPYTERCDWPALVECGDRPIVEGGGGDSGSGDNGGGDSGSGDNGGGDNGGGENGGTCNCNPGEAPGICGAAGSEGVLVAHENCNQFYKCANGIPVALFCPEGLLYNPYIERCDWPALVECGDRPIVEGGGGDSSSGDNDGGDSGSGDNGSGDNGDGGNGGGDSGGTCNCNPGEAPGICGAAGSEGVLVAHENCNQFYKCANGLPVALFCPDGLLYNPYTERCDWPALVECGNRPIVEGEVGDNGGDDSGSGESGAGDGGGNNNGDTCDPSQAPAICAASGSDGVLVAHENCNQFYMCSEGVPVTLDCPANLLYNSVLQVCDWPQNVECGNRVIPEEDNNDGGGDSGEENNGGDNGSSGGNSDPSEAPAICASDNSNGILIAHENCDQFYVCSYGKPVALSCPVNLLYNPNNEQCDWPKNVDCGDRIIPEPESGGNDGPCSCNAREAPSICAGSKSDGKLIAHENCNQYYVCFQSTPVARSCPKSLFYDPHTEQCMWPASVSCEGRAITGDYSSLNKHLEARREFF